MDNDKICTPSPPLTDGGHDDALHRPPDLLDTTGINLTLVSSSSSMVLPLTDTDKSLIPLSEPSPILSDELMQNLASLTSSHIRRPHPPSSSSPVRSSSPIVHRKPSPSTVTVPNKDTSQDGLIVSLPNNHPDNGNTITENDNASNYMSFLSPLSPDTLRTLMDEDEDSEEEEEDHGRTDENNRTSSEEDSVNDSDSSDDVLQDKDVAEMVSKSKSSLRLRLTVNNSTLGTATHNKDDVSTLKDDERSGSVSSSAASNTILPHRSSVIHEGSPGIPGSNGSKDKLSPSFPASSSSSTSFTTVPNTSNANNDYNEENSAKSSSDRWSSFLDRSYLFLNSRWVSGILLLFTIFLLFGEDVRIFAAPSSTDNIFDIISSVCFFIFILELVLRSICESEIKFVWRAVEPSVTVPPSSSSPSSFFKRIYRSCSSVFAYRLHIYHRGYFGSFLFFLDLVAIISMLPEIDWLWTAVLSSSIGSQANLSTVRASRISRIGSRVGRIIRIVRVVRLFKIYSLWRKFSLHWRLQRQQQQALNFSVHNPQGNASPHTSFLLRDFAELRESQMGSRLQHSITRRVIVMVIFMLLIVPVFVNVHEDYTNSVNTAALHNMNIWRGPGWEISGLMLLKKYQYYTGPTGFNNDILPEDLGTPRIVYISLFPPDGVPSSILIDRPDIYSTLRIDSISNIEIDIQEYVTNNVYLANGTWVPEVRTTVWWNERPHMRSSSIHTIGLTIFIIVILGIGALQLAADAQALVLSPIESMIAFVERTALDPVTQRISSKDNTGSYETQVLENAIKKVTGLLRVGFGSTGALIVAKHLDTRSAFDHSNNPPPPPPSPPISTVNSQFGGSVKNDTTTVPIDPLFSSSHGSAQGSRVLPGTPTRNTNPAFPIMEPLQQTIERLTRGLTPRIQDNASGTTGYVPSLSTILRGNASKLYVTNNNTVIAKHDDGSMFLHNASQSTSSGHRHHRSGGLPTIGLRKEKGLFNPYVPGRTVRAIFVRIGIPNASTMAAVLGPSYLPHFNRIAKIVHDTCLAWGGSPISNDMGTGFTCMWIIDDAWDTIMDDDTMIAYVAQGYQNSLSSASLSSSSSSARGLPGTVSKTLSPVTEETEGESKDEELRSPQPSVKRPPRRRASVLNLFRAEKDRVNNDGTVPTKTGEEDKQSSNNARKRKTHVQPPVRRPSIHNQRAANLGVAITGLEIGSMHTNENTEGGINNVTTDPVQAIVLAGRQMKERNNSIGTKDGIQIRITENGEEKNEERDQNHSSTKYRRSSLPDTMNGSGVHGKGSNRLRTVAENNRGSQRRFSFSTAEPRTNGITNGKNDGSNTGIELSNIHTNTNRNDFGASIVRNTVSSTNSFPPSSTFTVPSIAIEESNTDERNHDHPTGSAVDVPNVFFSFDTDESTEEGRARKVLLDTASQIAEKALLFCLKTILALRRARDITDSKEMSMLRESSLLKGYRPSLTFGLHVGSAIECAIGSVRKVDVSYVAPEATKLVEVLHDIAPTYHVPIILSDNMMGILRPTVRGYCRKIDQIRIPSLRSVTTNDASPITATTASLFEQPSSLLSPSTATVTPTSRIVSIYTYDVWDWTVNIPPSVLRTRMMQIINSNIQNGIRTSLNPYSRISPRRGMGSPLLQRQIPANDTNDNPNGTVPPIDLMIPQNVAVTPETLAGLPPILLPLSLMALNSQDADLFNPSRTFIPEHERCISIMGAADIIEHPIQAVEYTPTIWEQDPELKNLRAPYSENFRLMHAKAMEAYLSGDWSLAGQYLIGVGEALTSVATNHTKRNIPSHLLPMTSTVGSPNSTSNTVVPYEFNLTDLDYVSRMLYTTMAGYGFVPPKNWVPYRSIDE